MSNRSLLILLVCLAGAAVAVAAGGAAVVVWNRNRLADREAEFRADRERLLWLDRQFDVELSCRPGAASGPAVDEYRARMDAITAEQNAIIRKWQARLPNRVPQKTFAEAEAAYPGDPDARP